MASPPATKRRTAWEGTAKKLFARIANLAGTNVTQATLASVSLYCKSLVNGTVTAAAAQTISAVIFDTLQTWPAGTGEEAAPDSTGYNSAIIVPASVLVTGGDLIRVEVTYTPAAGQANVDPIKDVWEIEVLNTVQA